MLLMPQSQYAHDDCHNLLFDSNNSLVRCCYMTPNQINLDATQTQEFL